MQSNVAKGVGRVKAKIVLEYMLSVFMAWGGLWVTNPEKIVRIF